MTVYFSTYLFCKQPVFVIFVARCWYHEPVKLYVYFSSLWSPSSDAGHRPVLLCLLHLGKRTKIDHGAFVAIGSLDRDRRPCLLACKAYLTLTSIRTLLPPACIGKPASIWTLPIYHFKLFFLYSVSVQNVYFTYGVLSYACFMTYFSGFVIINQDKMPISVSWHHMNTRHV